MTDNDIYPVSITGKIALSDGSETEFSIHPPNGWQQWGNDNDHLWTTTGLLDALTGASVEHLREAED